MVMDSNFRKFQEGFRWDSIDLLAYKEEGAAPFKAITRQLLFADSTQGCDLRYFEMASGGHSTLERHQHMHAVMILRGSGHCLLGDMVRPVSPHDLVSIPAWTWHQFRATGPEPMGFLCMVNTDRDKPQLPTEAELAELRSQALIAAFLDDRPL